MANGGVPEIEPSVQPEAQPAPAQPAPPLQAFSGEEIGKGLTDLGKAVYSVGMQARHYASVALAQVRETQFQNVAEKIKADYKNLHGEKAVGGHDAAVTALEAARSHFLETLPTQAAKDRFMDGSFRSYRYTLESVGDHWDRENYKFQFGSYKLKQAGDLQHIREHPEDADKIITDVEKRAREQAGNFYDAEGVEAEVTHWNAQARAAAIRGVADHGGDVPEALKKWGDGLPESVIKGAVGAQMKQHVADTVEQIFKGVPLVDSRGKPDSINGTPDELEINRRAGAYAGPFPQQVDKAVHDRMQTRRARIQEVAQSMGQRIEAIAQAGGGFDLSRVPPTMLSELNAIDAPLYGKLVDREITITHRATRWTEHQVAEVERRDHADARWSLLYSKPDSAKSTYTKDQFQADLMGLPITNKVREELAQDYDRWSKERPDSYERTIRDVVRKEVFARWGTHESRDRNLPRIDEWAQSTFRNGGISKDYPKMVQQVKEYIKTGTYYDVERPPAAAPTQQPAPVKQDPHAGMSSRTVKQPDGRSVTKWWDGKKWVE